MKNIYLTLLFSGCSALKDKMSSLTSNTSNKNTLSEKEYEAIKAFGHANAARFQELDLSFDEATAFLDGVKDALILKKPLDNAQLMAHQEVLKTFFTKKQEKMNEKSMQEAGPNKIAGAQFITEYKKQPNVKTTPSGLAYEIINPGNGKSPTEKSTITVHYHGTLIDQKTVFDSSMDRHAQAIASSTDKKIDYKSTALNAPLSNMIKGWLEGLPLIQEGGKIKLVIPSDLAYGDRKMGEIIAPGSTLIFTIELLEVTNPIETPKKK